MPKIASRVLQQHCPICGTAQPAAARQCPVCGAALPGTPTSVPAESKTRAPGRRPPPAVPGRLNWMDDEIDLYEGAMPALPRSGLLALGLVIVLIIGAAILIAQNVNQSRLNAIAVLPTKTATEGPYPTNTPHPTMTLLVILPTLALPSVTSPPTETPTRGPCMQKASSGDTLSSLAARCGQYSMDVVPTILFDNQMSDPAQLRAGQVVQIPWPTPTDQTAIAIAGNSAAGATATPGYNEPTLAAGLTWYTVKDKDDAISIAYRYHTTIQFLHDLNPEVAQDFAQCDFGLAAGGSTCIVQLSIGQRLRVPAPTPTATKSLAPNGSETATLTPTPTINIPYLSGPGDNMLFGPADLPVLRWGGTGTLATGQAYLLTVADTTLNKTYTIATTDSSFQIPIEWQPNDGSRHVFQWSIAIVSNVKFTDSAQMTVTPNPSATSNPFGTESRTFTWQGP